MAKNFKKADETAANAVESRSNIKETKTGNQASRKSGNRRRSNDRSKKPNTTALPTNDILTRAKPESPIKGGSLVFPTDSASMAAFGNYTTVAGQENFIDYFNVVRHGPMLEAINVVTSTLEPAKRTSNAMRVDFVPYVGSLNSNLTNTFMNPIRMAALNLKQFVDTSFGTNTNYDPADLMIYLMAVAMIWPMIAEIKRDLRLTYTVLSKQFPQFMPLGMFKLLQIGDGAGNYSNCEGYEYTATHLRSFIDRLNRLILTFNRLPMPPELVIFGYNDDLFDAIFLDSDDVLTAQTYVFKNAGWWLYNPTTSDLGAKLTWNTWTESIGHSVEQKLVTLARMIESVSALRTSDTAMLQNLYNAYGSKDTAHVELLDFDNLQPLPFVYDEHILTMVENMNWGSAGLHISDLQVNSNDSNIEGHVYVDDDIAGLTHVPNLPLQFHKPYESITAEDVGWALRMHPAYLNQYRFPIYGDSYSDRQFKEQVTADGYVGFAIPTTVKVGRFDSDGTVAVDEWFTRNIQPNPTTGGYYESVFNDWSASPIFVYCDVVSDERERDVKMTFYTAHRDVECTYRLEDLQMHWTYLTQAVWAGNINRETVGTRVR